jgi:hypothetical protein
VAKYLYKPCEWKKIDKQHRICSELSDTTRLPYAVPRVMEAIIALNANFLMHGEHLFVRKKNEPITLFNCEESISAENNLGQPVIAQVMIAGNKNGVCVVDGGGWGLDETAPLMRFVNTAEDKQIFPCALEKVPYVKPKGFDFNNIVSHENEIDEWLESVSMGTVSRESYKKNVRNVPK